ncbi:Neisseria meningitidis TspB protein [compost metagenome]
MASPPPQVVTPEEIEEEMAPKPLPETLPPGFPYPLDPEAPFIFNPTPGTNPQAQPLRVPQGNPVPVPNTNPQQYRQPVTRFTPAPTADDPFRLDGRPEEIVTESPTGMTGPETVTSGSPNGEKPEQFDLCKEHPDIIACQVFKPDELEAKPVPNENKSLAITPDGGWGASTASCPADKTASLSFGPIAFSYEPLCLFASGIRPMVIALAWFSAALTFFGFARKDT